MQFIERFKEAKDQIENSVSSPFLFPISSNDEETSSLHLNIQIAKREENKRKDELILPDPPSAPGHSIHSNRIKLRRALSYHQRKL
ncbi:hypothetical protein Bca52824_029625 [Brassica carinata]|uniref:Uncharacterized protein n=1 Tax=Brassica carinata TaxID=52824 RepID=A0A8X8ART4_BRACI|nr:hypothetical protein Bca52824_029625 [Brassica carinata]